MKVACKSYHKLIILFISSLLLFFHLYTEGSRAFALSVEEEKILGQKFLAKVHKYFDLVDDDFANEYINGLGHYLISPLETKHFPYSFYIIKDNALNAFAAPGGHIFIFSGLIEVMDEIDELASVICHEIGHVAARHLAHRIEQTKKVGLATTAGMLAGILIGGKAAGAIVAGSKAASIQKLLSYSRNDERHADQLGFKYMDQAGFDPSGMITTLKKIQQGHWLGTNRFPSYLLTHPGVPERMSNVESMMTHYIRKPENRKAAKFRRLFPSYKTVLR
ncbi:MAG: M48 family metallopeptidase, partial [Desulfatiglandales bacterium]|nr:M48 family metallopeptidase [Desulfatiglandales bacterium]